MAVDIYQMITDKIIEEMEKGNVVWEKGWRGTADGAFNRITKTPYSFLNQMLLAHSGEYATFKQWQSLGGKIKKGSKSEMVVFWKQMVIKGDPDAKEEKDKKDKVIPILRYYNVFHISQIEGVEPLNKDDVEMINYNPIDEAENVINNYVQRETGLRIIDELGDKACYSESQDLIVVPLKEQFTSINEYYSTKFHEMTHSTGSKKRLKRLETGRFGSEKYSKEELIAEIGSAMLMSYCNIETDDTFRNSVGYLQSWISKLRDDKKLIVQASSKAEKAVKYILAM